MKPEAASIIRSNIKKVVQTLEVPSKEVAIKKDIRDSVLERLAIVLYVATQEEKETS